MGGREGDGDGRRGREVREVREGREGREGRREREGREETYEEGLQVERVCERPRVAAGGGQEQKQCTE